MASWSLFWGLGVLVVAPLWWWGVVFDLWIVVASIEEVPVSWLFTAWCLFM